MFVYEFLFVNSGEDATINQSDSFILNDCRMKHLWEKENYKGINREHISWRRRQRVCKITYMKSPLPPHVPVTRNSRLVLGNLLLITLIISIQRLDWSEFLISSLSIVSSWFHFFSINESQNHNHYLILGSPVSWLNTPQKRGWGKILP